MSLDTVTQRIINDAEDEAQHIINEAQHEAEQIRAHAREQAEELIQDAEKEAKTEAEHIHKQQTAAARIDARHTILNAKQNMFNTVKEQFTTALTDMDDDTQQELLTAAITHTDMEIGSVTVPPQFTDHVETMVDDATVVDTMDTPGIILENPDGTIRQDYTFPTVTDTILQTTRKHIADILFTDTEP